MILKDYNWNKDISDIVLTRVSSSSDTVWRILIHLTGNKFMEIMFDLQPPSTHTLDVINTDFIISRHRLMESDTSNACIRRSLTHEMWLIRYQLRSLLESDSSDLEQVSVPCVWPASTVHSHTRCDWHGVSHSRHILLESDSSDFEQAYDFSCLACNHHPLTH